jgi:hypothetical protein
MYRNKVQDTNSRECATISRVLRKAIEEEDLITDVEAIA